MEKINKADFLNITPAPKNIEQSLNSEPQETIEEWRETLRISLGLGDLTHTFENFKRLPGTENALEAFKKMATEEHKPMLLVYGSLGNGKSFLCEALSIALYRKGIRCRVGIWSELRRTLLQKMHRPKPYDITYDDLFESIRRCDRLIIDDIGMGSKITDWEVGELEDITNYRYREKLYTVFTTNRPLEELPERVVSRFYDPEVSSIVMNAGKDQRKRQV